MSEDSFAELVLPHLDAAFNLARWLVHDRAVAEDIVQDSVVRALQYFSSFRGGDARAWLLRIVRNTAYSHLASRKPGRAMSLDDTPSAQDVPDPAPGPEATLAHLQDLSRLDEALASLPAELRECLILCELEQLSYKEIAAITEVPVGTVMSRLWRARQALLRLAPAGSAR